MPDGLRVNLESIASHREGPPRVEVELSRSQYPADARDVFQPTRLPDLASLSLGGPLHDCLRRASARLTVRLRPGYYNFPLGDGSACQAEIQAGAQAFLRLEVGPPPTGGPPAVLAVDLHLQPPLLIHNLLETLSGLHDLVDDRLLALLRPLRPRVPDWLRQLGLAAVGSADSAAAILLEQASARPRWGEEPVLRFAFSGRVRWMGQLETRFERVTLPSTILPTPFASLERLLSAQPLATAELLASRADPLQMLETLCDTLDVVDCELDAELSAPALQVSGSTIDGARLEATVQPLGEVRLRGGVQARFSGPHVKLETEDLRVSARETDPGLRLRLGASLAADLSRGERPVRERLHGSVELSLAEGSKWPGLGVLLRASDRVVVGEAQLPLELRDVELSGGAAFELQRGRLELSPASTLTLRAQAGSAEPLRVHQAKSDATGTLAAAVEASLQPRPEGGWQVALRADAALRSTVFTRIAALPELDIDEGVLTSHLEARALLELCALLRFERGGLEVDLAGSRAALDVARLELELGSRRLTLPPGTQLSAGVVEGLLARAGLQGLALDVRWDLQGQPCLLHHAGQAVSLLTDELRQVQMVLLLDRAGKLSFAGDREGLYGVRYFNTLLNPAGNPEQLVDLLLSEDAIGHVLGAAAVFAPGAAELISDLRALWLAARRIVKGEGLKQPKDLIPRRKIARMLSLLLAGDARLQPRLEPIIRKVTEGEGLDLAAARELILQELGEFELDYEVTAVLNWLDLVLSPTEPLEPVPAEEEPALAEDPAYAEARAGLPSAAEIYAVVMSGQLDEGWARRLAELAPQLTRKQLGFILERASSGWDRRVLARLRYAHEIKLRVESIAESYGGVEYLLQPATIASFLGEAVGPLPGINHPEPADPAAWPPPCALGSADVAVLLQAGLATGMQGRRTQLNNRLLLELMRRQPPAFTREVLIELGHQSPRALSGILYAFLDQDQDQLAEPLDLVDLLAGKLDVPVPRQRDFLAGGNKARQSYYEALTRLADQIIEEANPYLARKAHLQVMRHPSPLPEVMLPPSLEALEERARGALARADEAGGECSFGSGRGGRGGPRQKARRAYESAFRACAHLLEAEPRAFQLPWLRRFWLRNEEALRVLSCVRGWQEDRDRDRHWLAVVSGQDRFEDEQELLQTLVRTLYWEREHQDALLADPLVRLLIDPPEGRYDFSIVSCMGVITDGKDGKELCDAYQRLEERRGVQILRAHTAIMRSLEYNAERIVEAIEACQTPWGIIGYSQGCANALMAESMLRGGTPEEQRHLERLVCRNFLFSAANGSAHGTAGMLKFMRALVLGERYLKHYQAMYSWEAIKSVLRMVRAVLDSRVFVAVLGGAHSLSFERARLLHRDGQFLDGVPTSLTRGVVTEDRLPETLEYLYYVLREQTRSAEQDTQVLIGDAVGSSTRVRNAAAEVLSRCDLATYPQATHHWAPLTKEIEFVTTERDLELAIYESPKDRLVWPWVEVNARFGRIAHRG